MTEKIFYDDLYKSEFDAVIKNQELKENNSVNLILDRTLFYPGGGGQPCDTGFINGCEVIDVFESGDDIVHVININENNNNENKFFIGEKVHGVINWDRRFELMQQHLGQHMLAAALYRKFEIKTLRMRIEGENVSMDLGVHVDENLIREAEAAANEIIYQDIKTEIFYPDFEQVKLYARKMPPKTDRAIRIIKIGDFDYVPCCGLHVKSTGEIGIIKVTSIENHKGGTRVNLRCGRPAFRWIENVCHDMRRLQVEMTCGEENLFDRVLNLKEQVKYLKARNNELKVHEIAAVASELLKKAEENLKGEKIGEYLVITHIIDDAEQDDVKRLFKILTEKRGVIALLAGEKFEKLEKAEKNENNETHVFLTFGCNKDDKDIDVREAFKTALNFINGKGGGSAFCTQGQAVVKDYRPEILRKALDNAFELIKNKKFN